MPDLGVWKELLQLGFIQKPKPSHKVLAFLICWPDDQAAHRKIPQQTSLDRNRKPMDEGCDQMRLYGKSFVWCLYVVRKPNPSAFFRKQSLVLKAAQVLDQRVTVDNIEGIALERQAPSISDDPGFEYALGVVWW
jgi:hypothetical protein